jgi:hypothetical protein
MSATHATTRTAPSLAAMAAIETKRLARNPFFIIATLITFAFPVYFAATSKHDQPGDLLSWPVIPAFFLGLTSLVVMARQTRSTEAAEEAMAASPGSEARRTQALTLACLLPGVLGLMFMVEEIVVMTVKEPSAQEWWFGTLNDGLVLAMLFGSTAVACLGGALLGVLSGRWLHFPGASAVTIVGLVVLQILGQAPSESSMSVLRLWTPWGSWHSGTNTDGTATLYAGQAGFFLIYALCLCAAAAIFAVRHDKTARTPQLTRVFAAVVVTGLVALALSMTTGASDNRVSDPNPWHVTKG